MAQTFRNIAYWLLLAGLAWGCWLMVKLSLPYTSFERTKDFLMTKQRVYHLTSWRTSFYVHVFTSVLILLAGFTQFSRTILQKQVRLHRWSGYIYIVTILLITGPAAIVMAFKANGGLPARASFVSLGFVWYICTCMAFMRVKQHHYLLHAEWMVRSYALTLSAITLRIYAYMFDVLQINAAPRDVYITIAWLSWVPNLLVAELIVRSRALPALMKK